MYYGTCIERQSGSSLKDWEIIPFFSKLSPFSEE